MELRLEVRPDSLEDDNDFLFLLSVRWNPCMSQPASESSEVPRYDVSLELCSVHSPEPEVFVL